MVERVESMRTFTKSMPGMGVGVSSKGYITGDPVTVTSRKRAGVSPIEYGFYGRQLKLVASSGLPLPLYWVCSGYGHNGRLRPGKARPVAVTDSGGEFFSTQLTAAERKSNASSAALPPEQCPMPGERNRRLQSFTFASPPLALLMRS